MSKGENIFKRKDGRWEARYIKDRDLSGKIRYGFCYGKTYKEAKEKVTDVKATLIYEKATAIGSDDHRFEFFCDQWFSAGREKIKESTCVKYETMLEKHIKPKLGGFCPQMFNDAVLSQFTRGLLTEDGLSPKTVKDILVVLRSILKYSSKHFPNVFPGVEIVYPRDNKREIRVLTREEQMTFVNYLICGMDACKFGVMMALLTGIRIGELCALRWGNISLENKTVRIDSTMQRIKDFSMDRKAKTKIVIGPPKSDNSVRTIPVSDLAAELCEKMNPESPNAYVLTGNDDYMEPRALQYRMKRYTVECGLDGVHFHTLRHTFATRCVEVGFEIKSLSEILGHSSTTITMNRYVHSSMDLKRDNMKKLSKVGL